VSAPLCVICGTIGALRTLVPTASPELDGIVKLLDDLHFERCEANELKRRIVAIVFEQRDLIEKLSKNEKGPPMSLTPPKSTQEEAKKNLDTVFKDVSFQREGAKIIIPDKMTLEELALWTQRMREQEETVIALSHEIDCYPIEGAYALLRVLNDKYGFVDVRATPGFFGDKPPVMIGLEYEPGKQVQVPWGRLFIPGIEGYLHAGFSVKRDKSVKFEVKGEIKRKSEEKANEIVSLIKDYVREKSIFKGRALTVEFPNQGDEFSVDPGYLPKVMDLSKVRPDELIFPADVDDLVHTALFAPIENTEVCRRFLIPLKRGVLLEGPFGVGKTLTAWVTALKCTQNGWTFIYTKKAADLDRAVAMAAQYQPCVVFSEDVDSVVDGEERTEEINLILNTLDGVFSKTSEILVVLTTNQVHAINKAMLRPGRIDTVVPVRAPDAPAVQRLIRLYGRELLDPNEDLSEAGRRLDGQIPAFIREAVERSKLSAIRHIQPGESLKISGRDLVVAANGMMAQIDLLSTEEERDPSDNERAAGILGTHLEGGLVKFATVIAAGNSHSADAPALPATASQHTLSAAG
jgi:transitional endoplasmic reticulum ATPase